MFIFQVIFYVWNMQIVLSQILLTMWLIQGSNQSSHIFNCNYKTFIEHQFEFLKNPISNCGFPWPDVCATFSIILHLIYSLSFLNHISTELHIQYLKVYCFNICTVIFSHFNMPFSPNIFPTHTNHFHLKC